MKSNQLLSVRALQRSIAYLKNEFVRRSQTLTKCTGRTNENAASRHCCRGAAELVAEATRSNRRAGQGPASTLNSVSDANGPTTCGKFSTRPAGTSPSLEEPVTWSLLVMVFFSQRQRPEVDQHSNCWSPPRKPTLSEFWFGRPRKEGYG